MRPCDLALDSNTAVVLDCGTQLCLWLGGNVDIGDLSAPELVNAASSTKPGTSMPPVIQTCLTLVQDCASGRFPVPELKVCREGTGDERYVVSRLSPVSQDPQSAIFAQLPHLVRSMDDDPEYTTAMLTHIARRLPPTDDPSFIKWADGLNINIRPALDIAMPPTPAPSRGGSQSGSVHTQHGEPDLATQLAAARLAAQEEASRAAAAVRRPVHLTAPVDRALFAKARRGASRPLANCPTAPAHTSPFPTPGPSSRASFEQHPGLPKSRSNPGSVISNGQSKAMPAPPVAAAVGAVQQQVRHTQPPHQLAMTPRSDSQTAPAQLPVGSPPTPPGRSHFPAPPAAERHEVGLRPTLASPPLVRPANFMPALRPYSLTTGLRQARPYGILPPGPTPSGIQGSARPPVGGAPRPPLVFAPKPGPSARFPAVAGGPRVSTGQVLEGRSPDSAGS
jgi:hypothetical protein